MLSCNDPLAGVTGGKSDMYFELTETGISSPTSPAPPFASITARFPAWSVKILTLLHIQPTPGVSLEVQRDGALISMAPLVSN